MTRSDEQYAVERLLSLARQCEAARPDAKAEALLELLTRLEKSGEAFLSNALIEGKFALRLCVVNFRTSQEDIKILPGLICRLGREVDAQLRVNGLGADSLPAKPAS